MKLYAFDGIDSGLALIPLAARRALDLAGQKLSLAGFLSLSVQQRQVLVAEGSLEQPDLVLVMQTLALATPAALPIPPLEDPDPATPPETLLLALGPSLALPQRIWAALSALDRASLVKLSTRHNAGRLAAAHAEIVHPSLVSTHLRPNGGVHMVSVSNKEPSLRRAVAESWVSLSEASYTLLMSGLGPKGDVLGTARLAGIQATKRTSDLIPLCHPLALTHADIDFEAQAETYRLRILCTAEVFARTGVEMEAMVGASAAALTVYDMLKSIHRDMIVGPCRLLEKSGGKSGAFSAKEIL